MKTIIAGSRHYKSFRPHIIETIIKYINDGMITEVLCGCAGGADTLGKQIAESQNIPVIDYPADWDNLSIEPRKIKTNKFGKKYNLLAGLIRNENMANGAEFLIAVWDKKSGGTKHMIDTMAKLNKPMLILYQE
jgi:hypothetical protein